MIISAGQKYGSWTVEADLGLNDRKRHLLSCRCDCGTVKVVRLDHLSAGKSKCCRGCHLPNNRTGGRGNKPGCAPTYWKHGDRRCGKDKPAPEYRSWSKMKTRCFNPNSNRFQHYGGRGITVCERWRNDYAAFLADVGRKPGPEFSIDRIDVNGHYEPGNVRWADPVQQRSNRRDSV